jgi:glycosyltransferase involved in cell wall biosynthesis
MGEVGVAPVARPARRIRVLYVCTALNRGSGGEMHPLALAKHLDRSRFDFAVCVIETAAAAIMEELERAHCRLYVLDLSRRFYNPIGLIRIVHRLYRLCARLKPDIVQTHALHANLLARPAARWAGVRVIIATENALPDIERNLLRRALMAPLHALNKLLDRSTQRIVVVSECVRRWADPSGRSNKVHVIAPPIRLDAFLRAHRRRPQSPSMTGGGAPVLGVVGRLSQEKGHRFLIAAMPEILAQEPRAQLLVIGAGPLEAELRAQVEASDLTKHVQFLGHVQDVETAFSRMDLLVVPSLSEAFSLVTVEGMMMELPVVGSRTGGIAEIIVDDETGLLVPPGDSAALAEACRYLLGRPDVARRMGRRGRERALADFHPSQFIVRHEALYACAVADQSDGRSPTSDRAADQAAASVDHRGSDPSLGP